MLAALGGAFALAWMGLLTMAFTDYEVEAEPALLALRGGDVSGFVHQLPAYGGSLVLRAPFALLPGIWGGGDLALFRAMAAPCLLAGVALGAALWWRARPAGALAAWMALALVAVNPLTVRALEVGHPEELLVGVLCVAAVIAATGAGRRAWLTAAILLGLAIGAKPWAIVAVGPVLLALPAARCRALAVAAAIAGALLMIVVLPAHGGGVTLAVAHQAGVIFQPWQLLWFFGDHGHRVFGTLTEKVGYRSAPGWAGQVSHPLVVVVATVVSLGLARGRRLLGTGRRLALQDALTLLALMLLLRCLLDTWNTDYYALPLLLALTAASACGRRVPWGAAAATVAAWTSFVLVPRLVSPDAQSAAYLAWAIPLAAGLAWALWSPASFAARRDRAASALGRALPTIAGPSRRPAAPSAGR